MGVRKLFDVIQAADSDVNIATLSGKTLALDLSIWIVELWELGKAKQLGAKFCLRQVFNRVVGLLRHGVRLVLVTDGTAPDLKHATLQHRQQQQSAGSSMVNADRPWLRRLNSETVDFLQHFGIPCLESQGEAEALCAHLDRLGIVDGSITNDSDYLCYGGKSMYRNFRKVNKNFYVDMYSQEQIAADHQLVQDDLISLALLIGSDYCLKGVNTVGPDKALKLLKHLRAKGHNPLTRLCSWKVNKELDETEKQLDMKIKKGGHCTQCDHLGSQPGHKKNGCNKCCSTIGCLKSCDQSCDCEWHQQDLLAKEHQLEIKIRRKALQDTDAAFTERCNKISSEFKTSPDGEYDPQQRPFNLRGLVTCARRMLYWDSETVVEKLVAMVIHCQLRDAGQLSEEMFTPIRIQGKCKDNHVDCYKVLWDKTDRNMWMGDLPGTNLELNIDCKLFARTHPAVVEIFTKENEAMKKGKGKKRKKEQDARQQTLHTFFKSVKHASKKLCFEKDEGD